MVEQSLVVEGYRPDYVKCSIPLHIESAVKLKETWLQTMDAAFETPGVPHSAHVVSVKSEGDGKYLYVFEAWGPKCLDVQKLDFASWAPYLSRFDVRREVNITQTGLDELYQHVRAAGSDRRNITQYNTRGRSKRNGRDSGGIGIAIGSHKSDLRMTFYQRRGEQGACEIQMAGSKLQGVKTACLHMFKVGEPLWTQNPWRAFMSSLVTRGVVAQQDVLGLYPQELEDILTGTRSSDETVEDALEAIEQQIARLPKDGQHAVHVMLQQRLFGEEKPAE